MRIFYGLLLALLSSVPAWADCVNPEGVEGQIIYNRKWQVMQFCNDEHWIGMGGGGGATLDDANKGDITISNSGDTWLVNNAAINNAKLADMPARTIKGNNTASAAPPMDMTVAQLVNMIIPTGAIWAFDLATCPTGWAEYVPARGRFLRGIDSTGTIDSGGTRAAGNLQADSIIEHTHGGVHDFSDFYTGGANRPLVSSSSTRHQLAYDNNNTNASKRAISMSGAHIGAAETRPKNVAVLYCRKS